MSNFYRIQFGLNAGAQQTSLINALSEKGASSIQLSDGIAVKTELSQQDIQRVLEDKKLLAGLKITEISKEQNADLPKDLQAFIQG